MDEKDWAIVFATLLAPLFAVQVSQFLERRRQKRNEQLRVFTLLMATRAATLDPRHVESLNLIDVVFHGDGKSEVEIRRFWKQYLDHLSDKNYPRDTWGVRRVELLVDLLHAIACHLGFDFDKTHIKNQAYYPEGYGTLEDDQAVIRKALAETLSGIRPLSVSLANLPQPQRKDDT